MGFSEDRKKAEIKKFPALKVGPFDTPFGSNTTTITLSGGGSGTYDPGAGAAQIPVTLFFDHSIDLPFIGEDSYVDFKPLTTGATASPGAVFKAAGSPLDATGRVVLAGASRFRDGFLDGSDCLLVIHAVVVPHP